MATLVAVARKVEGGGELKTAVSSAGVSSAANLLAFVTLRSSPACLCATLTHTHKTCLAPLVFHCISFMQIFQTRAFSCPFCHNNYNKSGKKESCKTLT